MALEKISNIKIDRRNSVSQVTPEPTPKPLDVAYSPIAQVQTTTPAVAKPFSLKNTIRNVKDFGSQVKLGTKTALTSYKDVILPRAFFTGIRATTEKKDPDVLFGVNVRELAEKKTGVKTEPTVIFPEVAERLNNFKGGVNKKTIEKISSLNTKEIEIAREFMDEEEGISNVAEFTNVVVAGGSSLVTALGLALITKNTSVSAGFLSAVEASDDYNDAIEAGKTPEEAFLIAGRSGVGTFALEKIGLDYFISVVGPNRISQAIARGTVETVTEEAQTVFQNINRKYSFDDSVGIFDGWVETAIGSFIPTSTLGLAVPSYNPAIEAQLVKDIQDEANVDQETAQATVEEIKSYVEQFKDTATESLKSDIRPGLNIEDVSGQEPLIQEAKKYKTADEFEKAVISKNTSKTTAPIKVFRGEGKGTGNTTLVRGKYFADSKKFASRFGEVTESTIPSGSKIFDLDKVKKGDGIISEQMLVDDKALTNYLIDNGVGYTKNTNVSGVEYVQLFKDKVSALSDIASDFKNKGDFLEYLATTDGYNKTKGMNRVLGDTDLAWNKSRGVGMSGSKVVDSKSQLKQIWEEANKATPESSLINEARKFKTADEFIENISFVDDMAKTPAMVRESSNLNKIPDGKSTINKPMKLLRGGNLTKANKGDVDNALFFTESRLEAEEFGKVNVADVKLGKTLVTESFEEAYEKLTGKSIPTSLVNKGEVAIEKEVAKLAKESGLDSMVWKAGGVGDGAGALPQVVVLDKGNVKEVTTSQLKQIWEEANKDQIDKDESQIQADKNLKEINDQFEEAESHVFTQLELSEAGRRDFIPQDRAGGTSKVIGVKSTFPDFVPEHLRSKKLFDRVTDIYFNNEEPRGSKQIELLNVIENEILSRMNPQLADEKALNILLNKIEESEAVEFKKSRIALLKRIEENTKQRTTTGKETLKQRAFTENIGKKRRQSPLVVKHEITLLKERLNLINRYIKEGTRITKKDIKTNQNRLINLIEKSGLEAKDKVKFLRSVKNIQTTKDLTKNIATVMNRITRLEQAQQKRTTKIKIKNLLKKTVVKKQSGKPVGKMTADIQSIVDNIRNLSKLTKKQADERLQRNLESYQKEAPPLSIVFENEILNIVANLETMTPAQVDEVHDSLVALIERGELIGLLRKINKQAQYEAKAQLVVDQVTGGKGLAQGRETVAKRKATGIKKVKQVMKTIGQEWVFDWVGLLKVLEFNTPVDEGKLTDVFSVRESKNSYKELSGQHVEKVNQMVAEAYGLKNSVFAINRKIQSLKQEVNLGKFKNADGVEIELKMTKDEMIKRYMEFRDDTLADSFEFGNKYTASITNAILKQLTQQDRNLANSMFKYYDEQYVRINKVYREIYGVDLPRNENYSPISRENFNVDATEFFSDLYEDRNYRFAVTTGSLKSRQSNLRPIKQQGALLVLDRHMTETNYFVSWADKIREFNSVFSDSDVTNSIVDEFGSNTLQVVREHISNFTQNGNRNARSFNSIDKLRTSFTIGALAIKPAIGIKQLISTVAYLEKLNPVAFTKGMVSFWSNPLKAVRTLNEESTMIRERANNMERDIKAALQTETFNKFNKKHGFIQAIMLNVQIGDKGAIAMGAWAMRQDRLKKGVPLKEVIKEYEEFSSETQQSSDIDRLSPLQLGGSMAKLFTVFLSSPRQYYQKEHVAVQSLFRKGGKSPKNIAKVARTLAIYHIMIPVVFQFMANFGRLDDEAQKDYLRAGIIGSINGIFILGQISENIVRGVLGSRVFDFSVGGFSSIQNDLVRALNKIDWDDITAEDVWESLKELGGASTNIGVPFDQAVLLGKGITDIMEGDTKKGIGELLGWSEYSITGGKKESSSTGGVQDTNDISNITIGGETISTTGDVSNVTIIRN